MATTADMTPEAIRALAEKHLRILEIRKKYVAKKKQEDPEYFYRTSKAYVEKHREEVREYQRVYHLKRKAKRAAAKAGAAASPALPAE